MFDGLFTLCAVAANNLGSLFAVEYTHCVSASEIVAADSPFVVCSERTWVSGRR